MGKLHSVTVLDSEVLRHEEWDHKTTKPNSIPTRWWRYVRVELRALKPLPSACETEDGSDDGDVGGDVGGDGAPRLPATVLAGNRDVSDGASPNGTYGADGTDDTIITATCGTSSDADVDGNAAIIAGPASTATACESGGDGADFDDFDDYDEVTPVSARASHDNGEVASRLGYVVLQCSMNALPLLPLGTQLTPTLAPKAIYESQFRWCR